MIDFRERVKELCSEQGITQKILADRMGISDISLNKTLRGKYPQLQTLEKIAEALDVGIEEIFKKKSKGDFFAYIDNKGELRKFTSLEKLKEYIDSI